MGSFTLRTKELEQYGEHERENDKNALGDLLGKFVVITFDYL